MDWEELPWLNWNGEVKSVKVGLNLRWVAAVLI
jgi:hypothetical protein